MRKYLAAVGLATALAQPASAVTFPSLTTIYVGTGMTDDAGVTNEGIATTFNCSNVSGINATLRFVVLRSNGTIAGQTSFVLPHGQTSTVSTHGTTFFADATLETQEVRHGAVNIESTQSAVFCSATVIDAADVRPIGFVLRLVRINGHPGAEE